MEELAAPERCELFGPHGWLVQGLLGGLSLASLLLKRWHEKPKRPLTVFGYDAFKLGAGSLAIHFINLLMSQLQATADGGGGWAAMSEDPCNWYLVHVFVDTTLGVFITYFFLEVALKMYKLRNRGAAMHFGVYGSPPSPRELLRQTTLWLCVVAAMKVAVIVLLAALSALRPSKLVLVMVIAPLVLNSFQYWITDSFIRGHEAEAPSGAANIIILQQPPGARHKASRESPRLLRTTTDEPGGGESSATLTASQ